MNHEAQPNHDELDRFDLYPTEMLQEFLEQATLARNEIMDTISVIYAVLDERNVIREEKTWH